MKKLLLLLLFMGVYANAQIVNIPDANFKSYLLCSDEFSGVVGYYDNNNDLVFFALDANHDGEIQVTEADVVEFMSMEGNPTCQIGPILSFEGINLFSNLKSIVVSGCNELTLSGLQHLNSLIYSYNINNLTLDNLPAFNNLSGNSIINTLSVNNCNLLENYDNVPFVMNFNISNCTLLSTLEIRWTDLSTFSISNCPNINSFILSGSNFIETIDLRSCTNLNSVECIFDDNLQNLYVDGLSNLTSIDSTLSSIQSINLSGCNNLTYLNLTGSQLTNMNFNDLPNLVTIGVDGSNLTTIDVRNCHDLTTLSCSGCPNLTEIFAKNGNSNLSLGFQYDNNLQYICANEENVYDYILMAFNAGLTNCNINSYCSFTPGGTFYTINGTNHYDENNNGCDAGDKIKFN